MSDTETITVSHNPRFDPGIRVKISADYGRWGEARSLREGIKKVLQGKAEIVEADA